MVRLLASLRLRTLVVGMPDHHDNGADLIHLSYRAFRDCDLADLAPDCVISWLFCPEYDALDIASTLSAQGVLAPYRAVSCDLPRPAIVRRELNHAYPDVDFDLIPHQDLGHGHPGPAARTAYEKTILHAAPALERDMVMPGIAG